MSKALNVEIGSDGIALLNIDVPDSSMNVMAPLFNKDLEAAIELVAGDDAIKGAIITSSRNDFMAGADLKWFLSDLNNQAPAEEIFERHSHVTRMLRRMETCGKPFVAAINGTALGGGFEVCLACHYRVAANNPRAKIGLPEVTVGLLPGGGGTQRLPRLIGVEPALKLLTKGTHLSPEAALEAGLVDAVVEPDQLISAAREWILAGQEPVQPWDQKGFKIPGGVGAQNPAHANLFMAASAMTGNATKGNYPAPGAILSAVYEGTLVPIDAALRIESRYFVKLIQSPVSRNIVRTMFVNKQAADKLANRPEEPPKRSVQKLGILGAGMMGAGIAYSAAKVGIETVLLDRSLEDAEKGKAHSDKILQYGIDKGRTTREKADALLALIHPTESYEDLQGCDLVIEAVFEDRGIKDTVTRAAEAQMPEDAIFASNTSTLPITGLAQSFSKPDQFIGLHFFSPVDRMPLVEVILGEKTSDQTLAWALDFVQQIRKTPIVVRDNRGFYTSRVFATYTNEGMALLKDGVAPALIENAATQAGMAVGPLTVSDEVTIELIYKVDKAARGDLGDDYGAPSAIDVTHRMVEDIDRLGRRYGKGFYEYPENGKKHLWPGLSEHWPLAESQPPVEEVKKRILYVQALDSFRCFDEGVIINAPDADIGSILGWGFPTWTGGTLSLIETVGLAEFVAECDRMHQAYGPRFAVPDSLRALAENGEAILPDPSSASREAA